MVPQATTIAVLINSNYSGAEGQLRDVQEAAPRLGVQLLIVRANAESEFNAAFSTSSNRGPGRSWSAPRHSSTAGGNSLWCWQHAIQCRQSTNGEISPRPAA